MFHATIGSIQTEFDLPEDFNEVLANPDKNDKWDPDLMLNKNFSNYCSLSKLSRLMKATDMNEALSIYHFNTRSLPKNLDILKELLYSLPKRPDIICVSESKLNETTTDNIEIIGYEKPFYTNSKTAFGGTVIYTANSLNAIERKDIHFKMDLVESTWIELDTQNRNKIIIGCVYKHPSANLNEFHSEMESIMKQFNDNKKQVFILGDINIDLLKYNIHTPTEDYVDMVFSNNFLPLITKPTRITDHSKTLIDHIYMNTQNDLGIVITGILKFDISDHLPVFCTVNVSPKRNDDTFVFRDYKKFNIDHYKHDLESVNWTNLFSDL